jgi:membrane fusion protein, copper/silver efflux system
MTEPEAQPTRDHEAPAGQEPAPPGVRTMAIVRWTLVGLMGLAAAGAVLYSVDLLPGERAGTSAAAAVYYCPMHPGIQQDHPGECPICGMTLVRRDGAKPDAATKPQGTPMAGHAHGGAPVVDAPAPPTAGPTGLVPVTLTAERVQLIGMRTAPVVREALVPTLRTVGFVTADEKKLARIQTRFTGWIERLMVDQTGQRVSRGQVLATVYSPELLAAQQEYLTAARWSAEPSHGEAHALTGTLAQDARSRLELLGISREEIDELEKTGKPTRALPIRSPVDGYVTQKNALSGLYLQPGTLLFEVADLSTIWVLADVYEYEIGRVKTGQKARLVLGSYPDQAFDGRVQFLYPTVDASTRTLKLRIEFKNPGLKMRPGMYGDVVIDLDPAEGLVVPREAVVDTGESQYVFIDRGGGRFEPRAVRLGMRSGEKVQVREGVAERDVVVTTGNFLIDSESRLAATIQGTGTQPGGSICDTEFDKARFPDKHAQCRACETQHAGMGSMVDDCKNAIPKPWR